MRKKELLDYYSNNFTIDQLSSEDILKLTDNYIKIEIVKAFNISIKEFDKIKKKKGIPNIYLENSIRNIAVLLNYIDTKGKDISDEFRKEFYSFLIYAINQSIPHRDFYIENLSQIDFSRKQIKKLLLSKEIDIQYRLKKLDFLIPIIDQLVETFLQEKQKSSLKNNIEVLNNNKSTNSINSRTHFNIFNSKKEITVNAGGENQTYYVNFSDEKYSINSRKRTRKNNGSLHNYKLENEKRQLHGKIGEKIALEAEKMRLISIGLEDLVEHVQLVAQLDEEITFDGLGYDIISFNKKRERVFIEVKTSFGKTDKPFFISKKEIELIQGITKEHECKEILIYYILIDGQNITIKSIYPYEFNKLKLTPILYKVDL